MNDSLIVTASVPAAERLADGPRPSLVVRCRTPLTKPASSRDILPIIEGLDVFIATGVAASVENAEGLHTTHVRFDSDPSQQWNARESTSDKALLFAPIYASQTVAVDHLLATSRRMLVQFTPFRSDPVTLTFNIAGFENHEAEVLAACPPFDESKWRVPPFMRRNWKPAAR